ncbi:MAG: hypothetical protein WCL59_06345, partial [Cyanobium sp. ELA507]
MSLPWRSDPGLPGGLVQDPSIAALGSKSPDGATVYGAGASDPITGTVSLEGPTVVGGSLRAVLGPTSAPPTAIHYQWQRSASVGDAFTDISGATGLTYSPTAQDLGLSLRIQASLANGAGLENPVLSLGSPVVQRLIEAQGNTWLSQNPTSERLSVWQGGSDASVALELNYSLPSGVTATVGDKGDRIFAGVCSLIDGAGGSDELFNTDSQGENLLVGGLGADRLYLRPVHDQVIGGELISNPSAFASPFTARADRQGDSFLIDSSDAGSTGEGPLRILDLETGLDQLLLDVLDPLGDWAAIRAQLQALNISINAAPELAKTPSAITLKRGLEVVVDLAGIGLDADGDSLQIIKLSGPDWITASGTSLRATAPTDLSDAQLAAIGLLLGLYDGIAVTPFLQPLVADDYTPGSSTIGAVNLGSSKLGYA